MIIIYLINNKYTIKYLFIILFTVSNPKPICVAIPYIPFSKVCIRLYATEVVAHKYKACANIIIKLLGKKLLDKKISCFKFRI